MSIKDLFKKDKGSKVLSDTIDNVGNSVESKKYVNSIKIERKRFVPQVDFSDPKNFARFGSAKKYYEDSIKRIYNTYPFDGSLHEKIQWHNSSSHLDNFIFENDYPRYNGYVRFSPNGWTTQITSSDNGYAQPTQYEYIQLTGTMNLGSTGTYEGANIYNSGSNRTANLKLDGRTGNTVEFYLKKDKPITSQTQKEVIFDLWNGETVDHSAGSQYGRFIIAVTGAISPNPVFLVTYVSGTVNATTEQALGATDDTAGTGSLFDDQWNHYAISAVNVGSDLRLQLYINGSLNNTRTVSNGAISEVTGALVANIGALRGANTTTTEDPTITADGWGKLSGSIDEFRYWRSRRSSEKIGKYWFDQVGGGTNTDIANVDLGVYYKFNEGITAKNETDRIILDYSGRISHGSWVGYSASLGEYRNTGSAIVESSASLTEFKDPTMYSFHPKVVNLLEDRKNKGIHYDVNNNAGIFNSLPLWMTEEDGEEGNIKKLTQIISSYFDELYLQIESLPKLKAVNYVSSSHKPYPFADRILESHGFKVSELFSDASELSELAQRDEKRKFEKKLHDVKNTIYQNIYNNLSFIYKSKGTEKAFRNLVRCYGVDDDLIKLSLYANNTSHEIRENFKSVTIKKKVIDFNNVDRFHGTVYQYPISDNSDSVSFISASEHSSSAPENAGHSMTFETEVIFPKKFKGDEKFYFETTFKTASLFGIHEAKSSDTTDMTWAGTDYANFQVYAVREEVESNNVYFLLTGSSGGHFPLLTSSVVNNVYDNEKWNFAVRITPNTYPWANQASGSADTNYSVQFYGINSVLDREQNSFYTTGTMNLSQSQDFFRRPKRLFVGAHRTNFTGSTIHETDVKISATRVWFSNLDNETIAAHSRDATNFGTKHPYRHTFLFQTGSNKLYIPEMESLLLHWDFNQITGSDSSGQFVVDDISSGTLDNNRFGWLGNLSDRQHTGRGDNFPVNTSSVVDGEYFYTAQQRLPETLESSDMVSILSQDDETFTRDTRPTRFFFSVEKSMYQTISEEMLKIFATIKDFNNLIGEPVNRYRQNYKSLEKLRSLFFERINNVPDVEKYIEFYKWIDDSITKMLQQFMPLSADISEGIRNVIESHVLERNKYWNKFPTLEIKQDVPEVGINGINELLYNWQYGYHPLNNKEEYNSLYWKQKALRRDDPFPQDATTLFSREMVHSASLSSSVRNFTTSYRLQSVIEKSQINNKKSPLYMIANVFFGDVSVQHLFITASNLSEKNVSRDELIPEELKKYKHTFKVINNRGNEENDGDKILPFNIFSSSVNTGYAKHLNAFASDIEITDLHHDSYIDNKEAPMQSPFTEKNVGGYQYRHHPINTGSTLDTYETRREGWKIIVDTDKIYIQGPESTGSLVSDKNLNRSPYLRGAKRSINIQNIQGENFNKFHQVVQTSGRKNNNKAFVVSGGLDPVSVSSTSVSGVIDYSKPTRGRHESVFVERFSAPGGPETAGDSAGGPGLDIAAGEYSVYNSINWRNLIVRNAYNKLSARHSDKFGFDSTYAQHAHVNSDNYGGSGSYHKVFRNPTRMLKFSGTLGSTEVVITSSVHNNQFITRPIPQSDTSYSWISSSIMTASLLGLATGSDEIRFHSASEIGSYYDTSAGQRLYGITSYQFSTGSEVGFVPDAFIPLNTHIYEDITASSNTLGAPLNINVRNINNGAFNNKFIQGFHNDQSLYLNSILLKRGGIYRDATWKQTRLSEHPVTVLLKKNNEITIVEPPEQKIIAGANGRKLVIKEQRGSNIKTFKEPPITTRFKPIIHKIISEDSEGKRKELILKHSYANNLGAFANVELTNKTMALSPRKQFYDSLVGHYKNPGKDNPVKEFKSLEYSETIFPREENMFLKRSRERENYDVNFWTNNRESRSRSGVENSQGFIVSQSIWPIDARENYETTASLTGTINAHGELQNMYTTFFGSNPYNNYHPSLIGDFNTSVIYFNPHTGSRDPLVSYSPNFEKVTSDYRQSLLIGPYNNGGTWTSNPGGLWNDLIGKNTTSDAFSGDGATPNWSISAWINYTSSFSSSVGDQPDRQTIISFGSQNRWFYLTTGSTVDVRKLAFSASYTDTSIPKSIEWITTTDVLNQDTWYHVAVVFDANDSTVGTRAKLYINGSLQTIETRGDTAQAVANIDAISQTTGSCIGSSSVLAAPYEGLMTNVSIFSGSLTLTEIQEIYNNGNPNSLYNHSQANSLISWWKMGGGSGLRPNDSGINLDSITPNQNYVGGAPTNGVPSIVLTDAIESNTFNSYENRIYDMAGTQSATPITIVNPLGHNIEISNKHTLSGSSEYRISNWSKDIKVGVLYARPTIEYIGIPWQRKTITTAQGNRDIRITGSYIFAGDTEWTAPQESGKKPFFDSYKEFNSDIRMKGKDYSILPEFRISELMDKYVDQHNGDFFANIDDFLTLTGALHQSSSEPGFYKTYSHTEFMKYFDILEEDHKEIDKEFELTLRCKGIKKFLPYKGFYPIERTVELAKIFSQSYGDFVKPRGYGNETATTGSWRSFLTPFFAPGILYNSIKSGVAVDFPIYSITKPNVVDDFKATGSGGIDFMVKQEPDWINLDENFRKDPDFLESSVKSTAIYGYPYSASYHASIVDAWDNPMLLTTGTYSSEFGVDPLNLDSKVEWNRVLSSDFSQRLPFESLLEPEAYLANNVIWDMNPEPSASLFFNNHKSETNQGAFWSGEGSQKFKLATHNFLAETINFFLKDSKLTTFASKPITNTGIQLSEEQANNYFSMDVSLGNSLCFNLTDYYNRRSLREFGTIVDNEQYKISNLELDKIKGIHTIMYNRDSAFGPPWVYGDDSIGLFTGSFEATSFHYSYEPFTPPYFNGFGLARLIFKPHKGAGNYTLEEIQENTKVFYHRMPTNREGLLGLHKLNLLMDWSVITQLDENMFQKFELGAKSLSSAGSHTIDEYYNVFTKATNNWMQLSASINLFGNTKLKKATYQKGEVTEFEAISFEDSQELSVWTIQPKWETPIFNFKNKASSFPSDQQGTGSLAKGMWHQYGDDLGNNEGIIISVNDVPNQKLTSRNYANEVKIWNNRAESLYELPKTNASCTLYIRDALQLKGAPTITVDGNALVGDTNWTVGTTPTNFTVAQNIADTINANNTLGGSPSEQLRYRVSASARLLTEEDENPYASDLPVSASDGDPFYVGPIAAVDMEINHVSNLFGFIDDPVANGRYTRHHPDNYSERNARSFPDYYADGELGNEKKISITSLPNAWIIKGGNQNGNKFYGDEVFFTGGSSPKVVMESLSDLLGFQKTKKKIGNLPNKRTIKEAVVAIPFVEKGGRNQFFRINRRQIDLALGTRKPIQNEPLPGDTIINMVQTMKDYVIPPTFDFVTNRLIQPFIMYMFEFTHDLTREDLKDIWQNLAPEATRTFSEQEVVVRHKINRGEFFNGNMQDKIRWMVFKVKQKAEKNYFAKTADSSDDERFKFKFNIGDEGATKEFVPPYSYNYPYDYFSLVELVKLDASIKIDAKDEEE